MDQLLNPYIAGAPVTEARMFFGREDVFAWIERSLSGQYADHILVLHGQRRVGKTSVLKQLPARLPDRYIPVFFDLQGRTRTSPDRFLWWLAREIVRVLKQDWGISAEVPDREAFTHDPEYLETHFLPGLRPRLGDRTLLLTFDEFDTLQEPEVRETLGQALVEILRRLMGREGLNFIYSIGSSGHKLENMQASYTEFFKTALYKKISFLERQEAIRLITLPVQGILDYAPEAAERIVRITSGHPYFTQLLCHELFSLCQKTGAHRIAEADVEGILEDVVERGTVNLKVVWDEASDLQKWILASLAHHEGRVDARALAETLHHQRVRFADHDLESALLHLREKDALTADNRFVIHLMRLWLQKNRPLEQVREELVERNPIASRYFEIGLEYLDTGHEDKALESFRQVLEIDPDNLGAHVRLAEVHLRQRRYAEAVTQFEHALAIDEEDVAARAGLCQARLALGDQALSRGRSKEAIAAFQQVLAMNPEHGEARQRMADLARQAAEKALAEGRDEEALASFVEAIGYTPEDQALEARHREVREEKKAKILASLRATANRESSARSWEKAARALEQALELAPEDPGLTEQLRATRASQRADHLQSLPEKARSLAASERWDEASAAWQEYLSLEPPDPEPAQAELERLKEARALAQTYAEAQAALARKAFDQAIPILKGIVARDETYKDATRLLLQAIEARRGARPKWKWKGIRLSRKARLALAAGLAALSLGAAVFVTWDQFAGAWIRGLGAAVVPAATSDIKVCLLTEADGIADAYYAPTWRAIEAAQTAYGIEGAYVEGTDESNVTERIEAFLGEGCDLVVSIWRFAEAMQMAAADHPEAGFLAIETSFETELPNLMGVQFKRWEAAFLAGYLAAGMTETGRVGTFGGMDIPGVAEWMDGFARGVEYYNQMHSSEVVVLGRNPAFQTGLFIDTWEDAALARQASEDLLDQGADVLFPETGPLTIASAEAAQQREGAYVIGATLDWATVYPEYANVLLSSAQFDLDEMVAEAIRRVVEGEFPGEVLAGNLDNGGVLLAPFHELDAQVPAELASELEALAQEAPTQSDPNLLHYSFPFDTITASADVPSNPDLLYLGTAHAGVYRSDDGGQTWQPARSGLTRDAITSLAIHQADPNLLYASAGLAGVYRSTDGGASWQPINQGIDLGRLNEVGSAVVLDPYRAPHLWFADAGSVYESTDWGENWIEHETEGFQFTNLVADPSEPETLFATSSGESPAVLVSRDAGRTWTTLLSLNAPWINPGQLAVDPVEGLHLYVSSESEQLGTYASSDGGVTWRQVLDYRCDHLAADPHDAAAAYCAQGDWVWRTSDGGDTWRGITDGELPSPISVLMITPGGYYAGTSDGLFVSTDLGLNWTEQSNGLPLTWIDLTMVGGTGPRLYAQTGSCPGIRSGVNAFDWEDVPAPECTSWAIRPNGQTAYATDGQHVWRSSDALVSWEERSAPTIGAGRLTVHLGNNEWVYSSQTGQNEPLFISADGALTWQRPENWAGLDPVLAFDHGDGSRVYSYSLRSAEIYRSDTSGGNWRPCQYPSSAISHALVDPQDRDRLLVATLGAGVLISADGCMSWTPSNDGLETLFVNTLALSPSDPDTIYAATDAGAYVSEDRGASWSPLSGWLPADTVIYSLVVDPLNPGVLYAATPEGVLRWDSAPTPVPARAMAATPLPTAIAMPSWVASFAEPILAVLPSRQPLFEDDFSTSAGEWVLSDGVTAADGALRFQITNTEAMVGRDFGTPHFALRLDFTPRRLGESTPIGFIIRNDGNGRSSLSFTRTLTPLG